MGLGDEGWGSPPDQRRRGRKPSRGVAFQLLERRTSRPDGSTRVFAQGSRSLAVLGMSFELFTSFQIATECKTPHLRLAQAGRWSRSLGWIGVALLGSASSKSVRCTSCPFRARISPVQLRRSFEQNARAPSDRGDADRRAPARVRLGVARLSRAIELGTEECCHRSEKGPVISVILQTTNRAADARLDGSTHRDGRCPHNCTDFERETSGRDSQSTDFI